MSETGTGRDNSMTHFYRICNFGGRLCGTQSERYALDYIHDYFSSLANGVLKVHEIEYDDSRSSDVQIMVNNDKYDAVALPGCGGFPADGVDLEVVDCGRGRPEDLQKIKHKIKGRAVLVSHEYMFSQDHVHRSRKFEKALSLGAAAFIIANTWEDSGLVSGGASTEIPAYGVSKKTGDVLRTAVQAGDCVHFRLRSEQHKVHTRTLEWIIPSSASNQGLDDKEIIVCAHIDGHALSQSAVDNASGVAVALEIAAQVSCLRLRSTTLRIIIFSAEEAGLLGSEKYVASLGESEKRKIQAVLNLDCVGGSTALCAMISESTYLRKVVLESSGISGIPVAIFEPIVPNSDHYNFAIAGIPALRLIAGFGERNSKLRHVLTSADTQELVSEQELGNVVKVIRSMITYME